MSRRAYALLIGFVCSLIACSSQRKLSHVETREPAAVRSALSTSPLREQVSRSIISKRCPAELRELFPGLAEERVKFPECPARLVSGFEAARSILSLDERTNIEELLRNSCRSAVREEGVSTLDALMNGFEPYSPRGGRPGMIERPLKENDDSKIRASLREGLLEVRMVHEPLEQWARINGEFVIPEIELVYFDRLVAKEGCKMTDEEVDQIYRTIHSLESLAKIENEAEPQRQRIERFLAGVHKVIGKKIQEYFRK